jgi:dienelactone hydrolase
MAIVRQTLVYDGPGGPFEGVIAYDDEVEMPRPGVLVVPNVLGQKEADNVTAERLAALGYVGFACDVFGRGKRAERGPAMREHMDACLADRAQLRDRLAASLGVLQGFGHVDAGRCAAIGYCFGGLCVLDMARAGLDILGGVSFHGVYNRPDYENVRPIRAKLLVAHGWDDPLGPPDAVAALAAELTDEQADWQLHAYGNAGHAFTDASTKGSVQPGFGYDENADRRSWRAMQDLLAELFV